MPPGPRAPDTSGGTAWHWDSDLDIASIGSAGYLEALDVHNGALSVVKGSHRLDEGPVVTDQAGDGSEVIGEAIDTRPGDIIAFDERF
ncbi:MAG TPA: phytanoyl-CoA dioxygenase family protein [Acidimicrobiales bacterium]|nr:phytanoyl-CoA dioxygenase family protein [Acidimicrobiales bacterium]